MYWRRRAVALASLFVLIAVPIKLIDCSGGDTDATQTAAASGPPECASPLFEFVRKSESYSKGSVAAAKDEHQFNLKGTELKLEPPIDWDQNPDKSTRFQGKLQSLNWMDPLLYDYVTTGDTAGLEQSRDISLDWIDSNPFYNPYTYGAERGGSKPWIDKVTAARIQFLAFIEGAAECEGLLDDNQKTKFRDSLETHGTFLADPFSYHETNHGLYANRGLYLLGSMVPSLDQAKEWRQLAIDRFISTLRGHLIGSEGFWLEHSAAYQLAINRLVDDFIEIVGKDPELNKTARQMAAAAGLVIEPDENIILSGDSQYRNANEEELASAEAAQGIHWLPKSGYAFVRRNDPLAYLSVLSSFFSTTHKHADELSFDLADQGRRIVTDTGLYHKDLDEFHTFQESAQAHSGVTVGTPTTLTDSSAYGSGIDAAGAGEGWYAILAHDPLKEQLGVGHSRLWIYRPGYALLVVDLLRSSNEHPYTRYFQLSPGIDVDRAGGTLNLTDEDGFEATLTSEASAGEKLRLVEGSKKPLAGFEFPEFREAIPRWTASYTSQAENLNAVAAFGLDPGDLVSAKLIGDPNTDNVAVRLLADGADIGTILVGRRDDRLSILASDSIAGEPIPQTKIPVGLPGNG